MDNQSEMTMALGAENMKKMNDSGICTLGLTSMACTCKKCIERMMKADPFTDEEGVESKVKVVGETCESCEG